LRSLIFICGTGVVAGVVVGWSGLAFWPASPSASDRVAAQVESPAGSGAEAFAAHSLAIRYAVAMQQGNDAEVIRMTLWMKECLAHAQRCANGDGAFEAAYDRLCQGLHERAPEKSRIVPEGIEDKYLFVPGAELEVVGVDAGRTNLAKDVRERTWIRVTYPVRSRAPRDEAGEAIRSLIVGVNVSRDGYILKAAVIGNLDIDRGSFSYGWPVAQGGG